MPFVHATAKQHTSAHRTVNCFLYSKINKKRNKGFLYIIKKKKCFLYTTHPTHTCLFSQ